MYQVAEAEAARLDGSELVSAARSVCHDSAAAMFTSVISPRHVGKICDRYADRLANSTNT